METLDLWPVGQKYKWPPRICDWFLKRMQFCGTEPVGFVLAPGS